MFRKQKYYLKAKAFAPQLKFKTHLIDFVTPVVYKINDVAHNACGN